MGQLDGSKLRLGQFSLLVNTMATDKASAGSGSGSNLAFTLVAEDPDAMATSQDLRAALEKGTDEVKLETLRRIIISTLNGQPHVSI